MSIYSLAVASTFFCCSTISAQSPNPTEWAGLFNSGGEKLNELYDPNAVLVTPGLTAETGVTPLEFYVPLKKSAEAISAAKSITKIAASSTVDYEIIELQAARGQMLKQLVVWKKVDDQFLRELEATLPAEKNLSPDAGIEEARNKWMELCNKHLPAELVSQVYTPEAIYYNHKPVVVGTEAISREYGYMASPQYHLKLTPLHLEMVRKDLAFELGQCSGSYGGKYMLIWVMNAEGSWQVALDSNI